MLEQPRLGMGRLWVASGCCQVYRAIMPPRFSIWMVLAGVMAGVIGGYLAGSGVIGGTRLAHGGKPDLREVRKELAHQLSVETRGEVLRSFDEAVRRAAQPKARD